MVNQTREIRRILLYGNRTTTYYALAFSMGDGFLDGI
jgi:hypothetical protein